MEGGRIIQGRTVSARDVEVIRTLIAAHPTWHRTRLSQELCRRWDWVTANGRCKDMAARSLLRKLDSEGRICLPAPVCSANNAFRHCADPALTVDESPIEAGLAALRPLQISTVDEEAEQRLFRALLQRYHYLGYRGPVGENLKYLLYDRHGRVLSCVLFAAPAWSMACRDRFIGWGRGERERRLALLANNMRFLIVPWVRAPHLASHVLGRIVRRVRRDWQAKYGHSVVLLETTVEQHRFAGTCYRAANWRCVGETRGRSRNDRHKQFTVAVKSVWLYPLTRDFRSCLTRPGP